MSGSIAAAAKAKLVGTSNVLTAVLAGLTGDDAVKVAYDDPRDKPRRCVYTGNVAGPVELAAMKGGTSGRVRRQEELTLHLYIRVYEPGHATTETTDADVVAISALIEDYIAANPTFDGNVANLKGAYVTGWGIDSSCGDDGSATSVVTLAVGLKSFLS